MNQDTYKKMVEDGRDFISILNSIPEDRRPMLSVIAGAYIDGMIAQERLTTPFPDPNKPGHE